MLLVGETDEGVDASEEDSDDEDDDEDDAEQTIKKNSVKIYDKKGNKREHYLRMRKE